MRIPLLVGAWLVGVVAVAFGIHVIAPFAEIFVSAVGCGLVGLAVLIAWRMTAEKRAFDATTVFDVRRGITTLALVVGGAGLLGVLAFDHWHEDVFVHDGLPDDVTIAVDGHVLGTVTAGRDATFENMPTNAEQIVATAPNGKPVDTADVDDAGGEGRGRFVFDVGGEACWQITEITYSSMHFGAGGSEPHTQLHLGTAHLFRAKSDYVGDAPSSVSSKSSSETRSLLEIADGCGGGR